MIGYFITSPVFGWLGDRWSRKWLIAAGILVWSVGTVLTGFAATFAMMLAFRVLVGVGEASYATISPSLISDSYAPAKRNNALTIFYVAIPVGAALGTIIGGLIAAHWGWRHAFIWAGVPGLLLALVLLPFAELKRGQAEGKTAEAAKRPSVRDIVNLFRIPDYVLVVLGYTAYTFALGAFGHWGPTFLHRAHGVAVDKAADFFRRGARGRRTRGHIDRRICRDGVAEAQSRRLRVDAGTLGAGRRAAGVWRVPRQLNVLVHDVSGGGDVLPVPVHRTGQHAHSGNRAGESSRQRHGRFHFHDPPLRRHVVAGDRRPAGGFLRRKFAEGRFDFARGVDRGERALAGARVENKAWAARRFQSA